MHNSASILVEGLTDVNQTVRKGFLEGAVASEKLHLSCVARKKKIYALRETCIPKSSAKLRCLTCIFTFGYMHIYTRYHLLRLLHYLNGLSFTSSQGHLSERASLTMLFITLSLSALFLFYHHQNIAVGFLIVCLFQLGYKFHEARVFVLFTTISPRV